MQNLSVLVSGFGSIGQRHAKNLQTLGINNLAICDPNEQSRLSSDIKGYDNYNEALNSFKPDIVFVCTPTKFHVEQAQKAIEAGAHVFIEKPLSYNFDGVDKLNKMAEEKGVTTMVGCNMRFHPGPKKIKELIDNSEIGNILYTRILTASFLPRWRRTVPYKESYSADIETGGAVLDCIHEIDLALWYFGSAKVEFSITIPATSIGLEVEGIAEILLRHKSGVISSVHLSFIQQDWIRTCEIIGTKGTIRWKLNRDFITHKLDLFGNDGNLKKSFPIPKEWNLNQMYIEEVKHFLNAIDAKNKSSAPLDDGIEALKIALEVRGKI